MTRWDAWRKYIAEGGKGSWPRDEFEMLLDYLFELIKETPVIDTTKPVPENKGKK